MAAIEDNPEKFSRCSFIPAEINHDFKGLFNENQDNCFNSNTVCTNEQLVKKYKSKTGSATGARRKSGAGDDDLVSQIFFKYNSGTPPGANPPYSDRYNKTDLKKLADGEHDIYCLTGTGNYSHNFTSINEFLLNESEYTRCRIYKKQINAKPYPSDWSNIDVFRYPYENFLLIDAVPFFVTSILKSLKFPECNPDLQNQRQEEITKLTLRQEDTADQWFFADQWPFRPKINIINTATTLGDGAPCTKPNAKAYDINRILKQSGGGVVPNSSDQIIPSGQMGVPLIYSWYYSKSEISNHYNTFMMSKYEIVTAAATDPKISYTQQQFWNISGPNPGINLEDANKRNRIPGIVSELKDMNLIPNKTGGQADNLLPTNCGNVNLFLQRKRSGDYLQIKSTYDFPRHAVENKDNSYIYQLKKGPSYAESNTHTRLHKAGSLKDRVIEGDWKNEDWYKKRTYFVTGDWPAFCYATYNKINCIITCKRGGGDENSEKMGGCSGHPTEHIIFRNFFD